LPIAAVSALLACGACSDGKESNGSTGGNGGANPSSGGASSTSGGVTASGGTSGGAPASGGSLASGGVVGSGGSAGARGGSQSSGGAAVSTGGSTVSSGGASATGGTTATGGTSGTSNATGGTSGGASAGAGGKVGTGGATGGSGGATGQPGVRWVGRVDASNAAAVKFAWSGTGLVARVQGTKVSVRLQTEGATSSAFYQPVIDGAVKPRFQVATGAAQTVVLADNLAAAEHTVELYRESEGYYGNSVFLGFVDGVLLAPPAAPKHLIEIIGDSISAGYGNLGSEVHPPYTSSCTFSLETESAYLAYSSVLGRSLDAEVSIIARSGWGMYRDYGGSTANVLSSIYENTLGHVATPRYTFARQVDAVLVNLGTNDSSQSDPGTPYEDAYVAFLRTVRSHYASAWIFLTIGPMTTDPMLGTMRTHIDHVVTRMADSKIVSVRVDPQDGSTTGCDFHPNVATDQKMAAALKTALQAKLGW
jgi:hypothetical protein